VRRSDFRDGLMAGPSPGDQQQEAARKNAFNEDGFDHDFQNLPEFTNSLRNDGDRIL